MTLCCSNPLLWALKLIFFPACKDLKRAPLLPVPGGFLPLAARAGTGHVCHPCGEDSSPLQSRPQSVCRLPPALSVCPRVWELGRFCRVGIKAAFAQASLPTPDFDRGTSGLLIFSGVASWKLAFVCASAQHPYPPRESPSPSVPKTCKHAVPSGETFSLLSVQHRVWKPLVELSCCLPAARQLRLLPLPPPSGCHPHPFLSPCRTHCN